MTLEEFVTQVSEIIQRRLDGSQEVKVQKVQKNNGVILHGLTILQEECNVSPTIYMEGFYEMLQDGREMEEIIERIISFYHSGMVKEKVDMSFFGDFGQVKNRIVFRLINTEKNSVLLESIPHVEILDLSICFYYAFESEVLGEGMITIYNNHMKMWKSSVQELLELATQNTPHILPSECLTMQEIIKEMFPEEELYGRSPMYVLTNVRRSQGAATILYPNVLEECADRVGGNYFVIPSSIHEMILVPDDGHTDGNSLHNMISEVNCTRLLEEEVLSDYPYYYDREIKELTQICN